MSLEEALAANTAALKENTAVLKALSGKTAEAAGSKTTERAAGSASKTKDEGEEPKRGRGRPPKAKTLSATEMGEKAREFCESAGDDEDEFKERRALCTKLAKKFGASKVSEIAGADDQTEALEALREFAEDGGGDGDEAADY